MKQKIQKHFLFRVFTRLDLLLFLYIIAIFVVYIVVKNGSTLFNIVQYGLKLFFEEEHDTAVEVLVVGAVAEEVVVVGIELHLKLLARLHECIHI